MAIRDNCRVFRYRKQTKMGDFMTYSVCLQRDFRSHLTIKTGGDKITRTVVYQNAEKASENVGYKPAKYMKIRNFCNKETIKKRAK